MHIGLQVRVERSIGWLVDWVFIETDDEIMICCSDTDIMHNTQNDEFVGVGRRVYWQIREVVARAADLHPCALYGLGNFIQKEGKTARPDQDIAVVLALPKDVFIDT